MSKKRSFIVLLSIMMGVTLSFGLMACSKGEEENAPTVFYDVELSDIESRGSMSNVFQFEEVNHRQRSESEEFYVFYFHDPGARKEGNRNRVVISMGKIINDQTWFEYKFNNSTVYAEYEDGSKETLILKKSVQRALQEGDILYINNVPYKRLSSFNENY